MESEVGKLRSVLARRESGRGRRFSPDLRRQISLVGRQMRDEGKSWNGIVARGLVLVTPSGFRIEGLDAGSAVMSIRRLS